MSSGTSLSDKYRDGHDFKTKQTNNRSDVGVNSTRIWYLLVYVHTVGTHTTRTGEVHGNNRVMEIVQRLYGAS